MNQKSDIAPLHTASNGLCWFPSLWPLENVWCTSMTISKHKKAITAFSLHFNTLISMIVCIDNSNWNPFLALLNSCSVSLRQRRNFMFIVMFLCLKPQQIGISFIHRAISSIGILKHFLSSYFEINCFLLSIKPSLFIRCVLFVFDEDTQVYFVWYMKSWVPIYYWPL